MGVQGAQGAQGVQGIQGPYVISLNGETGALTLGVDAALTLMAPTGSSLQVGQNAEAVWGTVGAVRFFAVDSVNGNDANLGYSDVSQAAAGAVGVSIRTLARLMQILPRFGQGRVCRVAVASGSYASDTQWTIDGLVGIAGSSNSLLFIGTGTVPSAGSVAFAGNLNDSLCGGFVTATGMNVAGYNVTAYSVAADGTPTITLQIAGGGSPGFTANSIARPYGCRLRFDVATTTPQLQNQMSAVLLVTGAGQLTLSVALPTNPVIGDVLYIEMPGVTGPARTLLSGAGDAGTALVSTQFYGFNFGALNYARSNVALIGCESTNAIGSESFLRCQDNVSDVSAGFDSRCRGGSLRATRLAQTGGVYSGLGATTTSLALTGFTWIGCEYILWERSASASGVVKLGGGTPGGDNVSETIGTNGSTAHGATCQIFGPCIAGNGILAAGLFAAGSAYTTRINFTNLGGAPAIKLAGAGLGLVVQVAMGSTGNTDVGLDLSPSGVVGNTLGATGCTISVLGPPTVTGTAGDVRLSDGTIITWATAIAGIVDVNGNRIFGAGHAPNGVTSLNGESGALSLTADPLLPVTTPTGTSINVGQNIAASWPIAITRVYAIDSTRPDDSGAGFADPATSSAADYALACQAAGAVAKKTWAGLLAIFPKDLNGHLFEIIVAAGTYAEIPLVLSGLVGVPSNCDVRGTRTDATAGVTKFDGSIADCTAAGGVTAAGMNAGGYNPTAGATTTSVPCQLNGGGAAGFAAEPARPLGCRMRFDVATATAALRNVCRGIIQQTGTNTLTPMTALPAAPAVGDVFYIEEGGVIVNGGTLDGGARGTIQLQLIGLRSTGTFTLRGGGWNLAGVGLGALNDVETGVIIFNRSYAHPVRGTLTVGGGVRVEGQALHQGSLDLRPGGAVNVGSTVLTFNTFIESADVVGPWVWAGGCQVANVPQNQSTLAAGIGTVLPLITPCRVLGSMAWTGVANGIGRVDVQNAGALPAIVIKGATYIGFEFLVSGSTGNNDVGLDLVQAARAVIDISTLPTVTGALGDVRLADGTIVSWAVAALGIRDTKGNVISSISTTQKYLVGKFSGGILGGAGATTSYLADIGTLPTANLTAIRYPTSQRFVTRLSVFVTQNSMAAATSVTLYKNNVATALTLNVAAGVTGNIFASSAGIFFSDEDDFAIVLGNPGDATHTLVCAATIEGP